MFSKLAREVNFCFPCTIYLCSCHLGLGTVPQKVADATSCVVYAPQGYCQPNAKKPAKSKVLDEIPPEYEKVYDNAKKDTWTKYDPNIPIAEPVEE